MDSPDTETCFIDGFGPVPVRRPESIDELSSLVRDAAQHSTALYPVGGRTQLDLGMPPTQSGQAIDLRGLDQVIDYPARDMTITVQSGITIARLQELLRQENQRLPIDVARSEQATLGGAIATNACGSRRFGFGTLRDYVIGISVINDQGETVSAGGRVVKNVAGYDLCKLYIGSLGTLGIVSQVTLKVKPIPESQAFVIIPCQRAELADLLARIHASRTRSVCVDVLNAGAGREMNQQLGRDLFEQFSWSIIVGLEENHQAVQWQLDQLQAEIVEGGNTSAKQLRDEEAEPVWSALRDGVLGADTGPSFKITLLPGKVAALCESCPGSEWSPLIHIHAGNGIARVHYPESIALPQAKQLAEDFQRWIQANGAGSVTIIRCASKWKTELPIWGEPRGDWEVMKEIKAKLDPKRIFNPGRFVGGI